MFVNFIQSCIYLISRLRVVKCVQHVWTSVNNNYKSLANNNFCIAWKETLCSHLTLVLTIYRFTTQQFTIVSNHKFVNFFSRNLIFFKFFFSLNNLLIYLVSDKEGLLFVVKTVVAVYLISNIFVRDKRCTYQISM